MLEISRYLGSLLPVEWLSWILLGSAAGWALVFALLLRAARQRSARRALEARVRGAEVRRGHLVETLAPLLDRFPVDPRKTDTSTIFLGQPVDYVHFDPEEGIHFIEIKSGTSRLTAKQLRLRERVEEGAVRWHTISIDT